MPLEFQHILKGQYKSQPLDNESTVQVIKLECRLELKDTSFQSCGFQLISTNSTNQMNQLQ